MSYLVFVVASLTVFLLLLFFVIMLTLLMRRRRQRQRGIEDDAEHVPLERTQWTTTTSPTTSRRWTPSEFGRQTQSRRPQTLPSGWRYAMMLEPSLSRFSHLSNTEEQQEDEREGGGGIRRPSEDLDAPWDPSPIEPPPPTYFDAHRQPIIRVTTPKPSR